jgi:hypothetical protein
MAERQPTKEEFDRLHESVGRASDAVLDEFDWIGLPDYGTDQWNALSDEINAALLPIMREWL